jgi:hypothetical protein
MGAVSGADGSIGVETPGFTLELPWLSLIEFQAGLWPRPVEEVVDDLLKQVYKGTA